MKLSDIVEPLPAGAWNRNDHSERQTVSCRPADMAIMYALQAGTGVRHAPVCAEHLPNRSCGPICDAQPRPDGR